MTLLPSPPTVAIEMKSVLVACLLILAGAATVRAQQSPMLANGIVAIVNDRVITVRDVYAAIRGEMEFIERRYASQPKVRDELVAK